VVTNEGNSFTLSSPVKPVRKTPLPDKFQKKFDEAIELFNEEKYQQGSDLLFDLAKQGHLDSIEQLVYIFLDQADFDTVKLLISYYNDQKHPTVLFLKARLTEEASGADSARQQFQDAANAGSPNACAAMAEYLMDDGFIYDAEVWVDKAEALKFINIVALRERLEGVKGSDQSENFPSIPLSEYTFAGEIDFESGVQVFLDPAYLEKDFLDVIKTEMGEEDRAILTFENGYGYFRKRDSGKSGVFVHYLSGVDKRVDSILICEESGSWKGTKLKAGKKEEITFDNLEEIGSFTVDSGQIMIADLETLKSYKELEDPQGDRKSKSSLTYDSICKLTLSPALQGVVENAFASSTGYGDGTYNIYEFADSDKRLYIFIDFLNFIDE
jgi:hypothetical protein